MSRVFWAGVDGKGMYVKKLGKFLNNNYQNVFSKSLKEHQGVGMPVNCWLQLTTPSHSSFFLLLGVRSCIHWLRERTKTFIDAKDSCSFSLPSKQT